MKYSNKKKYLNVTRITIEKNSIRKQKFEDAVIIEAPLTIFLNEREILTILCTPENLKELAAGYLYTERYITRKKDILSIEINEKTGVVKVQTKNRTDFIENLCRSRFVIPDCTNPVSFTRVSDAIICQKVESKLNVKSSSLILLMKKFQSMSKLFRETGGTHSAALCTEDEILFFNEDIGRHNAIDKVIGWCILHDVSMKDKIILTSGRISSAVCLKIIKAGIPLLISRSSPTSESVRLCEKFGITMIGFARGRKMNIYTISERIL